MKTPVMLKVPIFNERVSADATRLTPTGAIIWMVPVIAVPVRVVLRVARWLFPSRKLEVCETAGAGVAVALGLEVGVGKIEPKPPAPPEQPGSKSASGVAASRLPKTRDLFIEKVKSQN